MAHIRELAALPLREWATVFGVSPSTIKRWADDREPNVDKLNRVLAALEEASTRHPGLADWLTICLPGMDLRPIDLLRDERWRAFCGAIRARSAPAVDITSGELMRRRRAEASWMVPEPPIVVD